MTNHTRSLPDALDGLRPIRARLAGKRLAVFLDFDGTLTPIVDKPDRVRIAPAMSDIVRRLARRFPLAIISGRDCADVQNRVGIDSIVYAGSHGFDIRWPDGRRSLHEACRNAQAPLDRTLAALRENLAAIEGILFETKKCSFAVHFRLAAAESEAGIRRAVSEAVRANAELRVVPGKKVLEILPATDWNKGRALLRLMREMKLETGETTPLFIGDDITDEDAFRAIESAGIGIVVGGGDGTEADRATHAHYGLGDTDDVQAFLAALDAFDDGGA